MQICFLCSEYPPVPHGGAGTFTQVTARALVRAGHRVRVIGLYPAHQALPPVEEEDEGVSVRRLRIPPSSFGWLVARVELFRVVRHWIREGLVDVVDAPDHEGPFFGWPRIDAPLVQRAGGSYSYFLRELGKPVPRKTFEIERLSYRRADAWIAKSEYIGKATRRLFRLPTAPDATLYNPVDVPVAAAPFDARDPLSVVFTGTLTAKKGIVSLLEAWPRVLVRAPGARLHVFGKDGVAPAGGSMMHYLQARLPQSLEGSVHFHGHVSRERIVAALSTAGVAVFPSFAEGFAWAPLEAMATGCPTVYSRAGSGPELITHGRDGLLVDPDNPADIAAAILRVIEDDKSARQLGAAGRERVALTFSAEKLLPENVRFYENILGTFHRSVTRITRGSVA